MRIELPPAVSFLIAALERGGFEAYVVGGCVRDSLMGRPPADWDVCTSALPAQVNRCFAGHRTVETGLKHGTVTLVLDRTPYEITTYRVDGAYADNRRPDRVTFVTRLSDDLARRDFTINAMAYSDGAGLVDLFGGRDDLRRGLVRCVGDPDRRFGEDALRMLRALRFASVLNFSVDTPTGASIVKNRALLKNIAAERINAELSGLLRGEKPEALSVVADVLFPELGAVDWAAVGRVPRDLVTRLAALLRGVGADAARAALLRLKYDRDTIGKVAALVAYSGAPLEATPVQVKCLLREIGAEAVCRLADLRGVAGVRELVDAAVRRGDCYSLAGLAVNGDDLIAAGMPPGRAIRQTLEALLDQVIAGTLENERETLLKFIKR
ncbi:polynucleotide adenylyltransferase [Clostridia bacterium]|nr:polynucleotide adenylyltransferase [Clostridia bacterium]